GTILYGKADDADILIFDYARSGEDGTQTVACFRIPREAVWERFPGKPQSVNAWSLEYGAHGWLCLYKSGRRVKPGQIAEFLNEAKRIVLPPTENAEATSKLPEVQTQSERRQSTQPGKSAFAYERQALR